MAKFMEKCRHPTKQSTTRTLIWLKFPAALAIGVAVWALSDADVALDP